MKKIFVLIVILALLVPCGDLLAQCSLCTKTAQQLGEGPARGLNKGILMLAFTPLALAAILGLRWWRSQRAGEEN